MEMESEILPKQSENDILFSTADQAKKKMAELEKTEVHLDMEMLEKLKNMPKVEEENQWSNRCIYRVPSNMRELNPRIYTPKLVSFGPYHYGAPQLMEMEKHKYRALANVLNRTNTSVEDIIKELRPVVKQLMESYSDLDEKLWKTNEDKFLQLMLLDGIFWLEMEAVHIEERPSVELGYSANDPVFSSEAGPFARIDFSNDMKLLENQLPNSLLTRLSSIIKPNNSKPEDREKTDQESDQGTESGMEEITGLHFLDELRQGTIGKHREIAHENPIKVFYTATTSKEAAITFKKKKRADSDLDMEFDTNTGTLSIPQIEVSRRREIELLNMVAYELQRPGAGHEISSYILFITRLIATVEDVKLLSSKDIIISDISSEEEIAELLQNLFKTMRYNPKTSYDELRSELRKYGRRSMKKWNRRFRSWRLNLDETYFKNPWSFISLLAAIFLLALTVLGAVYTALSYYKPGK